MLNEFKKNLVLKGSRHVDPPTEVDSGFFKKASDEREDGSISICSKLWDQASKGSSKMNSSSWEEGLEGGEINATFPPL